MMDTDAIYREVCAYGAAKGSGCTVDAWDHIDRITGLLREADEEHKSLLATNEKLVDEVAELKSKLTEKASLLRGCYAADHKQKQRIEELTAERDALKATFENTLAECRDAYPVPEVGSELEGLWGQAMGNPESVGVYVKACATSQKKEIDALKAEELKLHQSLAQAVLHAEQGWSRYENANQLAKGYMAELERIKELPPVHQWRAPFSSDPSSFSWNDGHPDHTDGGGPYETRTLYALGSKHD